MQGWTRCACIRHRLIKPPGALAIRLAGLRGRVLPRVDRVQISVFAADHAIAVKQVSAFSQAATAQMIDNFAAGGAAISALGGTLEVTDLGTVGVSRAVRGVRRRLCSLLAHSLQPVIAAALLLCGVRTLALWTLGGFTGDIAGVLIELVEAAVLRTATLR